MAPFNPDQIPGFTKTRRSSTSSSTASTSTPSPTQQMLSPSGIAGVTVGVLVAAVIIFFTVGTITNYFCVRRRAKTNEKIEAQHRRWWSSIDEGHPSLPAEKSLDYWQPSHAANSSVSSNGYQKPVCHYQPSHVVEFNMSSAKVGNAGSGYPEDPEKIGIAISPDIGRTDSPESFHSHSSVANLLPARKSKALPAIPPAYTPARPESTFTVFEDVRQSQVPELAHLNPTQLSKTAQAPLARASSLRPRKTAPAPIQIPLDKSSPLPVMIFPPVAAEQSRAQTQAQNGSSQSQSQDNSSRSNSSSPPNYSAFPAPPASKTNPLTSSGQHLLAPLPSLGQVVPRKETPSYLPAYYTDPTPPAPVQMAGANQNSQSISEGEQNNGAVGSAVGTAAPELDPSSASSDGSDTSFESALSDDETPTEHKAKQPEEGEDGTGPESPIKNLRYPEVPRPSSQIAPRTPPSKTTSSPPLPTNMPLKTPPLRTPPLMTFPLRNTPLKTPPLRRVSPLKVESRSSPNISDAAIVTPRSRYGAGVPFESPGQSHGQATPTRVAKPPQRTQANAQRPLQNQTPPRDVAQVATRNGQWPQRRSSKREAPGDSRAQVTGQSPRRRPNPSLRLNGGDMFIEIDSP